MQNSYNKHGRDSFSWRVLEECSENQLNEKEIEWISKFDSYNNGYNSTIGGRGINGWKADEEFKSKMSSIVMGNKNPNYGNKWTDEMKKKASDRIKESGVYKGCSNPRARKIICVETLEVFDCIREASEKMNIGETSISIALRKRHRVASGYHYAYYTHDLHDYLKNNQFEYLKICYSESKDANYYSDLTNKCFYTGRELYEKIHSESKLKTREIKELLKNREFEINNVQYELLN